MTKSFTWIVEHSSPKINVSEFSGGKVGISMNMKTNLFTTEEAKAIRDAMSRIIRRELARERRKARQSPVKAPRRPS